MKRLIFIFLGVQILFVRSAYSLDEQEQISKASIDYIEHDDATSAVRRLSAVLDVDPDNLEANWLLLLYTRLGFSNTQLEDRIGNLREAAPDIDKIVALAEKQGNSAFGHFVLSQYAADHNAYDRALDEINKALEKQPKDVRYNQARAEILIGKGHWKRNNDLIYQGIDLLKKTNDIAVGKRPAYFTEWHYHFEVAYAYGELVNGENCPSEAIDHYMAVVKTSPYKNTTVAYAWNNVSCAYRKIGRCDKAKEASEHALAIMKFGAARQNLRYSEYCLQMQELNMLPEQ